MPKMSDYEITLDLDGPRVTVKQLSEAADKLIGLLGAVDRTVTQRGTPALDWVISGMKGGSAHFSAQPQPVSPKTVKPGTDKRVVEAIASGLEELAAGTRPDHFDDTALRYARSLAGLSRERGINGVSLKANGKAQPLGKAQARMITEILGQGEWVIGSVEGRLETLSIHDGNTFTVYESGTGHGVQCRFPPDLLRKAHAAFDQRVSVFGRLFVSPEGRKRKLQVRELEVFPPDSELPDVDDVTGILKNG